MISVIVPITATKTANADISLPVSLHSIDTAYKVTMSDATNAGAVASLTVITSGTPAAGQILLVNKDTIHVGDALDTKNIIVIYGIGKNEDIGA